MRDWIVLENAIDIKMRFLEQTFNFNAHLKVHIYIHVLYVYNPEMIFLSSWEKDEESNVMGL